MWIFELFRRKIDNDPLGERNHRPDSKVDLLYEQAVNIIFETGQASGSMLQRRLSISWENAQRLLSKMEIDGIIGSFTGSTPREILISKEDFLNRKTLEHKQESINISRIIQEENEWRRRQMVLPPIEAEIEKIDNMGGLQFEYWCADLLRKIGFIKVEVTQGSGDQGVDILAVKDGIKYAIQCKCYASDLGNKPVQEVNTGKTIYHCQIGAVMTNRYFTQGGKEAAEATGVLLWDRDWIQEKLQESGA